MERIEDIKNIPHNIKIYLYGAGQGGELLCQKIRQHRKDVIILGFIDDIKSGLHNNIKIFHLDEILNEDNHDLIIISSVHEKILSKNLIERNLKKISFINQDIINPYILSNSISTKEVTNLYDTLQKEIDVLLHEMDITTIDSKDIVKEVEAFNIGWDLAKTLKAINIKNVFDKYLHKDVKRLAIYPCSIFVENSLSSFKEYFDEVVLYDDYRDGETISGITIQSTLNIKEEDEKIDAYFISTRIPELKDYLIDNKVPKEKAIWVNDIVFDIQAMESKKQDEEIVNGILEKIHSSKNPLIVLGGKYYNNYTPTFKAFEDQGYDIFIISRVPEVSHTSPNPSYHLLPFENKYILNINQILLFADKIDKGKILIHSEGFLNPQFEGFKTLCSYVYPLILLRKIKTKKYFFLYDLVKPFYKNYKYENEFLKIYKKMLNSSDGLILNSNTDEAVGFLKYSLGLKLPMMSYFRYNFEINKKQEKLKDGFHIVMVGGFLDDVGDEMRTVSKYAREILSQGLHLHYYASTFGAKAFRDSLSEEQKRYFHLEKTIMDQNELLYDISKYHAGWMVHNTQKISDMISQASDQFLKDVLYMFMVTTVPSAVLLFGSAGLPMFLNRSMHGLLEKYPKECFMPMELSETIGLIDMIDDIEWKERYKKTEEYAKFFTTEFNINEFIEFIN